MTRAAFHELFLKALDRAAQSAEHVVGPKVSRSYKVELHGLGHSGAILDPQAAIDVIYLGDDRFFKIIDVAVIEVAADSTTAFVRVSGHTPCEFAGTWNPNDLGPFQIILSSSIRDRR